MKKFYLHYSGLKVARDGEILVPKSGVHPEHYTYGVLTTNGHKQVQYKGKRYSVHVLVAEVFLNGNKPIDTKTYAVHHIDENPENNTPENLLILSHEEHNRLHHKGEKNLNFGKFGTAHHNSIPIIGTNKTTGEVMEFGSIMDAQRTLGIQATNITACCKGKQRYKSAGGWLWEYKYA